MKEIDDGFRGKVLGVANKGIQIMEEYFEGKRSGSDMIKQASRMISEGVKVSNRNQVDAQVKRSQALRLIQFIPKDNRTAEQKFYLAPGNIVSLRESNILAFYCTEKPSGAIKLCEGKKGKDFWGMAQGHIFFNPDLIPFRESDNGTPIRFTAFDENDPEAKFRVHWEGGVTAGPGGSRIKQEAKLRPVMNLPWFLNFRITLIKNGIITAEKIHEWTEVGGVRVGLGTYRPRYGRFFVERCDPVEI